jgi:hypothetical protein
VLLLLVAVAALPAEAQTRTQRPVSPRGQRVSAEPRIGIRGYVLFGNTTLAAKETFDAVADTNSRVTFGAGVQVTNIWKGVFADVGASQLSLDGERVFVHGGQVFELGIPLEVTMRPLDIAGGWRLGLARDRIFPYVAAGLTYLQYEETSEFAQSDEDLSASKAGPLVIGGVDVRLWRWIAAGGEVRWRRVAGILGDGGVSAELDEDDAGGVSAAVRVSIGR